MLRFGVSECWELLADDRPAIVPAEVVAGEVEVRVPDIAALVETSHALIAARALPLSYSGMLWQAGEGIALPLSYVGKI